MMRAYYLVLFLVGAEWGAAGADRKQPLLGELGLHVSVLECAAEGAGELHHRGGRRPCWRHDAVEDPWIVNITIFWAIVAMLPVYQQRSVK
jgi:hypothetical protein